MGIGIDSVDPQARFNVQAPRVVETDPFTPFGIVTGVAYADLDAIGSNLTEVIVPTSGKITGARYSDKSNQGLRVDIWLFNRRPSTSAQTDNAALVVADADLENAVVIPFADFSAGNTGQVSNQTGLDIDYVAPEGKFWMWAQARGALTVTAAQLPNFKLFIRPDREA